MKQLKCNESTNLEPNQWNLDWHSHLKSRSERVRSTYLVLEGAIAAIREIDRERERQSARSKRWESGKGGKETGKEKAVRCVTSSVGQEAVAPLSSVSH